MKAAVDTRPGTPELPKIPFDGHPRELVREGVESETESPPTRRSPLGTANPELAQILAGLTIGASLPVQVESEEVENAILAAITESSPENPVEAMLLSQMVGAHIHATQALSKATNARNPDEAERWTRLGGKLMEIYARQVEALAKLRRKGTQVVRVERVTVEAGGQAVVGSTINGRG